MRGILPEGCILVLIVLVCGCIQSPSAPPVTPAETSGVSVFILPDTTATLNPLREINVTATETLSDVIIQYNGGKDAAALTALNIRITNQDGTTIQRTIQAPAIGKPYAISYFRNANADVVNIVGVFNDGSQQTVLMTRM